MVRTCVISVGNRETKFSITDIKSYVPVVTLPTKDNSKLLQQLKSGFKKTINWNKYQSKERQNQYLSYLLHSGFQGVNRLLVLSFENNVPKTGHAGYFLPKVA